MYISCRKLLIRERNIMLFPEFTSCQVRLSENVRSYFLGAFNDAFVLRKQKKGLVFQRYESFSWPFTKNTRLVFFHNLIRISEPSNVFSEEIFYANESSRVPELQNIHGSVSCAHNSFLLFVNVYRTV